MYLCNKTPRHLSVVRNLWTATYNSRCRNKLVSLIHTSFPYKTQPQAISYLGLIWITQLSIGMSSLVDFTMIAALSLSQFLVGHDDIKSPFLVFVFKVTTSFKKTQNV